MRADFYNLRSGERDPYPWVFLKDQLDEAAIANHEDGHIERLYSIFGVYQNPNGDEYEWQRTERIDDGIYTIEVLDKDPFDNPTGEEDIYRNRRWEMVYNDGIYIVMKTDAREENFIRLVGWTKSSAYGLIAEQRFMRFIPEEKQAAFRLAAGKHADRQKYVEFEIDVPKMVWLVDSQSVISDVRKGITKKITRDLAGEARRFVEAQRVSDEEVVKRLPDEAVISLEDSYASGNCKPGTQSFVERYFPGKTSVLARELKKHTTNPSVLRVLKYVARTRYGELVYGEEVILLEE